jgi:hypothetical protein
MEVLLLHFNPNNRERPFKESRFNWEQQGFANLRYVCYDAS